MGRRPAIRLGAAGTGLLAREARGIGKERCAVDIYEGYEYWVSWTDGWTTPMATLLPNSTFLDFTSYGTTTATTVADAYGLSGAPIPAQASINVAVILPRANDPTALLASNWGTRQATLEHLNDSGTLWSTYGASATDYTNTKNALAGYGTLLGLDGNYRYITSQDSRTVRGSVAPAEVPTRFGTPPYP